MHDKTIYITAYTADETQPSRPVPAQSLEAAADMFGRAKRLTESERLIVLDLGGGQRMAVSDYRFN